MIIYIGTKETIKKQIDCKHNLIGPCIDNYFRYNECIKCSVRDYDIRTEEQFYKTLIEKNKEIKDVEIEEPKIETRIIDLLKLTDRPFTLNWYEFKKDKQEPELSEEEQDYKYSERICAEPGCYNYPMSGVIYCIRCMHGSDQKASDEVIAWKKKKEGIK